MKVNVAERPFIDNVLDIVEENYRKFQNQVWPIRLQHINLKAVLPRLVFSTGILCAMQSKKIVSTFTVSQHSIGMHVFFEVHVGKKEKVILLLFCNLYFRVLMLMTCMMSRKKSTCNCNIAIKIFGNILILSIHDYKWGNSIY